MAEFPGLDQLELPAPDLAQVAQAGVPLPDQVGQSIGFAGSHYRAFYRCPGHTRDARPVHSFPIQSSSSFHSRRE